MPKESQADCATPLAGRRVCMLVYSFFESDTRVMQYASALVERGDIVDVIALRRGAKEPVFQVLNGVNVYRIQVRTVNEAGLVQYGIRILRFLMRSAWFLWRRHRQRRYHAIHVHNVPDFLVFAAIAPKLRGVPIILDIHDLLPEFYASKFKTSYDSLLFRGLVLVERLSASFADHIIVANHIWRDRFAARSSVAEKCSVVRNAPDLQIFSPALERKRSAESKFIMLYPGSLNHHQGLDIAIRSFASVAVSLADAEFHIYGEGPAKPALIDLAHELGMEDRILFHSVLPSSEIAAVMARAALAIEPKRAQLPFSNEALSTKIMEFMALGVPVIASKTLIHAYYYDKTIVEYYENDDAAHLAEKMVLLHSDAGLRTKIAENAKRYVAQNNWDARRGDYLQIVDRLAGRGRFSKLCDTTNSRFTPASAEAPHSPSGEDSRPVLVSN